MKNLSTTVKLLLIIIPALAALIALSAMFINSLYSVNEDTQKTLYDDLFVPTALLLNADRDFYQAYVAEDALMLLRATEEADQSEEADQHVADYDENAQQAIERFEEAFAYLKNNSELYEEYRHKEDGQTLKDYYGIFTTYYDQWLNSYDPVTGAGDYEAHLVAFNTAREAINKTTELLESNADDSSIFIKDSIDAVVKTSIIIVAVVTALLLIIGFSVLIYLKKNIQYVTGISKRIAQGELNLKIDWKTFSKDEIGQLNQAMGQILARLAEYSNYIKEITAVLETMKQGDMTIRLSQKYDGEFSSIKTALMGISASLNRTLSRINTSAEQVSIGASQVSDGAQALAAGSTEQAASVEELNTTIVLIAEQSEDNLENVKAATKEVEIVESSMGRSNEFMSQLSEAMAEISASSNQIANITKVIEDIAFQTNILALNAAIEAARAGNAGKGFAVVADEVRNLAAKSGDAARQTADLIQSSVAVVARGTKSTADTANALKEVEASAVQVGMAMAKIEKATAEQVGAIEMVKQGLGQVSSVVQNNAATAEENSATSEEMSAQAATLREEVGKFRLSEEYESKAIESISLIAEPVKETEITEDHIIETDTEPEAETETPDFESSFGKY